MKRVLYALAFTALALAWVPAHAAVGADVSVTTTTADASVVPGEALSLVITVTAGGTGASTDVTVLSPIPDTIPSWTVTGDTAGCTPAPDNGTVSIGGGSVLKCDFASIAQGDSKVLTLEATPGTAACPGIEGSALAVSSSDTDPSNNSAAQIIDIACGPDVAVSVSGASIAAGRTAQFNLTVRPGGNADPTGVVLTDVLPAGLAWAVSDLGDGASSACAIATGTLTCNFGTMARPDKTEDARQELADGTAPPAVKTIVLKAPTTHANCGTISNTADVTASNDSDASNNTATADIAVRCGIAMEVADSINHVTDLEYALVTCPTASLPRGSHTPKTQGVNGIIALVGPAAGGTVTITPTGLHADEELFAAVFYDAACARIPGSGLVQNAGDTVSGPIPSNAKAISILYVEGPELGVLLSSGELHGLGTATLEFALPTP